MRCVPCGGEMILVSVVPDETMIVTGFERYTLQCLECGEVEHRLMFKSANGRQAETAVDEANAAVARQPLPESSAWLRAVERLRGRQTAATERRAEQRAEQQKADRVTEFYRDWENLIPQRPRPAPLPPPKPKPPREIKAAAQPPANPTDDSRWARAVAKLRERQQRG
jgi:hypothetical protein